MNIKVWEASGEAATGSNRRGGAVLVSIRVSGGVGFLARKVDQKGLCKRKEGKKKK